MRALLGCADLPPAPCRGYSGDCADLPSQFEEVVPNPLAGFQCHQFPDPDMSTVISGLPDQIFVSLIMVAVAIPTRIAIGRCFEARSNPPVGHGSLGPKISGIYQACV